MNGRLALGLLGFLVACLLATVALAQNETFKSFINGLPVASPLASGDQLYILQGGVSKKTPFSLIVSGTSLVQSISPGIGTDFISSTLSGQIIGLEPSQFIGNDFAPNGGDPVWHRLGVALQPNNPNCAQAQKAAQEHGVIYDTNPGILTQYTNVFKMWYHSGFTIDSISYAESGDGLNWTCYSGNPILGNGYTMVHSVVKTGTATYRIYPRNESSGNIDLYTCTNFSCTLTQAGVLAPSTTPGAWDAQAIGNAFVWQEAPTTWHMMYFGKGTAVANCPGFDLALGLANSTDGITWTKSVSNPVLDDHCASGPYVYKSLSGTYYLWDGMTGDFANNELGDITRWSSSNLTSWTRISNICTFCRATFDEGFGNPAGGVTDPSLMQVNGQTYMYYVAQPDQSGVYNPIKLAVANMTLENLITTNEGFLPLVAGGYGNPFMVGRGPNGEHINLQRTGPYAFIGMNCAFNFTATVTPDAAGQACAYLQFAQQGTNASAQFRLHFLDTSGNDEPIFDATIAPGGTPDKFGLSSQTVCIGDGLACSQSIGFWFHGALTTGGGGTQPFRMGWFDFPSEVSAVISGSGAANMWDDSTTHRLSMSSNNGNGMSVAGLIANGATALGTTGISSGTCAATVTASAVNALSTDVISWSFNAAPGSGWPSLTIEPYPTANVANFNVCNPSASTVTPAAASINWNIVR